MSQNYFYASAKEAIDKVIAYATENLPAEKARLVTPFIGLYYANMALEDIQERSVSDIYGAVLSHWGLMSHRKVDEI